MSYDLALEILTLPYMGFLSARQTCGGAIMAPPIFSRELYNVWIFGVYIHVYTHEPCLHGNFQTSPVSPSGAMTSFLAKIGSINKGL